MEENKFICNYKDCDKSFKNNVALRKHRSLKHPEAKEERIA